MPAGTLGYQGYRSFIQGRGHQIGKTPFASRVQTGGAAECKAHGDNRVAVICHQPGGDPLGDTIFWISMAWATGACARTMANNVTKTGAVAIRERPSGILIMA